MNRSLDRRQAIKMISGAGLALYFSPGFSQAESAFAASVDADLARISPIDRTIGAVAPRAWFADYPDRAHKVLWDKPGFIASLAGKTPKVTERVPLVIIGGGMGGLASAYLLRKHKPVILEQAPRFGGNSKGQSWNGVDYAMGAAYFIEPEPASEIERFITELGINKQWKLKSEPDPVALNNAIFTDFWTGGLTEDPSTKAQILKLAAYFAKVNDGTEIEFPDIPVTEPRNLDYIKSLDRQTFKAHLEKIAEAPLTDLVAATIEQYCWSSFGASSTEISAAAGLNFYAAEFGRIAVLPGGNAAVAEQIVKKLLQQLPANNLRTNSLVYDVAVVSDGVIVSYLDDHGAVHAIHAQSVVMACPKFVVGKTLSDIEPQRTRAIQRLKYHSYLVANVCIAGGDEAPFYDLYMLGDGKIDFTDIPKSSNAKMVTDVIFADYARAKDGVTVLSLYRGFPYDGARLTLLAPDSYERYRSEFEKQIADSILPLLKIKPEQVKDVRIARWGHPLPAASPGLIAEGVVDELRRPFKDRVFFVEQDNWALPAFETAVMEAYLWAPKIEAVLAAHSAKRI